MEKDIAEDIPGRLYSVRFADHGGAPCELACDARAGFLWIGRLDHEGNHLPSVLLTRELAAELLPLIQRFIKTGSIAAD